MPRRLNRPLAPLAIAASLAAAMTTLLFLVSAWAQEGSGAAGAKPSASGAQVDCLSCHAGAMGDKPAVDKATLQSGPHKDLECVGCHSSITSAGPHPASETKEKPRCAACHPDEGAQFARSSHARPDKQPGDHPTCVWCHGGGNPHAVKPKSAMSHVADAALCSRCHADRARMTRYGVDPDAVSSYDESFHGKALLAYGKTNVAVCIDCHGQHAVLPPSNPDAPTNRNHVAATCGKVGCHPGARINFAMSGANHLRLKLKQSLALRLEEMLFKYLTLGTIVLLLAGVALDLRLKVWGRRREPASGRLVAMMISLSFLLLVVSMVLAFFGVAAAQWVVVAALAVMALALLLFGARSLRRGPLPQEPRYQRFTVAQRVQHALLALSFTTLVLTGLPLRFPQTPWLHTLYGLLGGIGVARVVHRVAAVVMIGDWIWHSLYLLYRWKKAGFGFASWTMFPTLKDVRDFFAACRQYLGLSPEGPRFDRFGFKEKFDYFAVYWGMPIMVISGLILWFPIYFGNRIPEIGLSAAYIAHSDEAILAFLAIVTWHFYNTHFNPDNFPMSKVWLTGEKTHSQMEHEHPIELERIAGGSGQGQSGPASPQLEDEPK